MQRPDRFDPTTRPDAARRRLPSRAVATTAAVSILWSGFASANVVGSDTQNFNPATSGLDFVTVQSSETLEPGFVNFGFFLNYAVNSLPWFDDTEQGRLEYTDTLLGADLNIGIGLLPGFDIGLSAPQVLMQSVQEGGWHGQFAERGNTEARLNAKVRLFGDREGGMAVVGSANVNRIKNNPYTGEGAGPTSNLELVADTTVKRVAFGLNLGRRWRRPGEPIADAAPLEPMRDQWIASGAVSYLFSSIDTKLIFEVFGSKPVEREDEPSGRLASSAEALLGLKHDFTTNFSGHLGGGTELVHGRGSPDWRIYAGVNWAVGPTFSKPTKPVKTAPQEVPSGYATVASDPFKGPPKPVEKLVIHDILFEFDSDHMVLKGSDDTLKKLVDYLNLKPVFTRLIIEGHTDSIGSVEYNADLSLRRARNIRKWLIDRFHLDPKKVEAVGKGEAYPIADNGNYQGRQLNRRVEFMIYRNGQ